MASSKEEIKLKCGNPYKTLNLPNFASSAKIKKAFRDLSLKLHPDKRKPNLTKAENEKLDLQFIYVQEAKSFLLDIEFATQKEKYDLKLKSDALREEQEKRREEMMDGRRKGMTSSLEEKIRREMEKKNQRAGISKMANEDASMENLRKAGKRMREQYAEKRQREEENDAFHKRKKQKQELQDRQVRVKWSRAKMVSQSDDMIAKLLSDQFGAVENVELIGRKGNAALVTFANSKSCKPCVDHYSNSDKLRASYVGRRKDEYDDGNESDNDDIVLNSLRRERDRESVEERKLRQEAERERILRQMESGEYDESFNENQSTKFVKKSEKHSKVKSSMFPPQFPSVADQTQRRKTYFERLEEMERKILRDLVPSDLLLSAQVSSSQ